jgi:DNA-binding CsgD family transcriptional regulator/N-acetylneuraminic acid mutarotase
VSDEQNLLSDREMEIVRLLATGATNQQIAQDLVISPNTVKVHLRNIYTKLEVSSRTEATMVAVRQGWVEVPRAEDEEADEEALEGGRPALASSVLPRLGEWPPVPLPKRIALVAAVLLAAVAVFVPQVLQSGANGQDNDPIRRVFLPSVPATRWRTRAQMPSPRADLAVVEHEGLIYAIGGVGNDGVTAKVEVYDPQVDAWTTRRAKPTPVGFVSAVVVGDKIYVPGGIGDGQQYERVLEVYDPIGDLWQTLAPMPEALGAYGLAALEGQIYLFGGRGPQGYVDTVHRYDPQADLWETLQPMEQARGHLAAAALRDRIYVVGGYDGQDELDACDVYDPAIEAWTPCAALQQQRGGLVVVPVRERLYTIGGGMSGYLAFNESYDPRVDAWTQIETPITGEWHGLGAAFVGSHIYAIGGWSEGALSTNEAYQALFQVQIPIGP